jgi:hypothetical protein
MDRCAGVSAPKPTRPFAAESILPGLMERGCEQSQLSCRRNPGGLPKALQHGATGHPRASDPGNDEHRRVIQVRHDLCDYRREADIYAKRLCGLSMACWPGPGDGRRAAVLAGPRG